jgi:hypothetical protein
MAAGRGLRVAGSRGWYNRDTMSSLAPLGFGIRRSSLEPRNNNHLVVLQRPLRRVLAFTRRSIDDVVNCPIAKREVLGYYKLHKWVERGCEITDMNRWWDGKDVARRVP